MKKLNKTTSVQKLKEIATQMLYRPVVVDEVTGFLVFHPFFTTINERVHTENGIVIVDITTADGLKLAREQYLTYIDRINSYQDIFRLVRSPYLPAFFKSCWRYFSRNDFASFLAKMWLEIEYPNSCPDVSLKTFTSAFKNANKEILMSNKERRLLKVLPDEVVIYRGVKPKARVNALSWTLSYETAKWFADRFEENGTVYRARIRKEDILAYFDSRGESEVVVQPSKLYGVERVKEFGTFADRLRMYRINKLFSQEYLAEVSGVDRTTITRYETGERKPTSENLKLLAEALGIPEKELMPKK